MSCTEKLPLAGIHRCVNICIGGEAANYTCSVDLE